MDVRLAGAGRAADGQLLERTAVAAHRVTLEVDEYEHTVIILDVLAQIVDLEDLAVFDGPFDVRTLGVHDVNIKQVAPMMLLHQLDVLGRLVARAAVGCVALNNGAVDGVDDGLHKLGVQVVLVAVLAAMDLDGHLAGQLDAKLAVHLHNGFGGELVGEIDSRVSHNRGPPFKIVA